MSSKPPLDINKSIKKFERRLEINETDPATWPDEMVREWVIKHKAGTIHDDMKEVIATLKAEVAELDEHNAKQDAILLKLGITLDEDGIVHYGEVDPAVADTWIPPNEVERQDARALNQGKQEAFKLMMKQHQEHMVMSAADGAPETQAYFDKYAGEPEEGEPGFVTAFRAAIKRRKNHSSADLQDRLRKGLRMFADKHGLELGDSTPLGSTRYIFPVKKATGDTNGVMAALNDRYEQVESANLNTRKKKSQIKTGNKDIDGDEDIVNVNDKGKGKGKGKDKKDIGGDDENVKDKDKKDNKRKVRDAGQSTAPPKKKSKKTATRSSVHDDE